ncbi:MFS transporter (plasmid) [Candidatus Megaera polyxenophila]|nr:MFS transporter [Candidatus Megaera polyxenophila]
MAVLLNELFFPQTDPFTASLLSAFAFCSTFVFRPFGALLFGYIGDTMGRRVTVVITTIMMAISCIIMAISPTYAEIGITASVIITLCRIVQGLSSMGEVIGAELYVAETIQKPYRYFYVSLIPTLATTGGMLALAVATFVTQYTVNWRYAFWAGAVIALIGTIARSSLRETPDFVDAKQRLKRNFDLIKSSTNASVDFSHQLIQERTNPKTFLALFFIGCSWPVCFYLCYIHCGNILREFYNFSSSDVIKQNFIVSIVHTLSYFALAFLSLKIHPLKIVKIKILIFTVFSCSLPMILSLHSAAIHILLVQLFIVTFSLSSIPASAIFYKCFPVFQRFKCCSFTYALSRAVMHVITSFGMIYIINMFGNSGVLIILVPVIITFTWGILHFCKLEKGHEEICY